MASFSDPPVGVVPSVSVVKRPRDWEGARRELARRVVGNRHVPALAVAAPLVGVGFVRLGASGRFAVGAFLIMVLALLSAIDVAERRLPNRIVLPAAAVVFAAQTALYPDRALEWLLAAVGGSLFLLVPLLVYRSSVGMGDVKLMLLIGAALGSAVVTALLVASVAAAAFAAVLLVRGGAAARHRAMPFGPFLAFGAVVALLL